MTDRSGRVDCTLAPTRLSCCQTSEVSNRSMGYVLSLVAYLDEARWTTRHTSIYLSCSFEPRCTFVLSRDSTPSSNGAWIWSARSYAGRPMKIQHGFRDTSPYCWYPCLLYYGSTFLKAWS